MGLEAFPRKSVGTRLGPVSIRQRRSEGRALVFLHGIGGNADAWRTQYETFDQDFRVVGWDAPGYGDSLHFKEESPGVEQYAEAFVALLDALEIDKAVVVGHSLGGLIAACAAATYPQRFEKLILAACSSGHATYEKEKRESILRMRLEAFASGEVSAYAKARVKNVLSPAPTPQAIAEAIAIMSQIRQPGFPQATRMVSASDIFPFLSKIHLPTRVVCGTEDQVTPPALNRKIADSVSGADFIPVKGAGHWIFLEYPDAFNAAVRGFVT